MSLALKLALSPLLVAQALLRTEALPLADWLLTEGGLAHVLFAPLPPVHRPRTSHR